MSIFLTLVDRSPEHVALLYSLLAKRKYSISHSILPSYEDHENFVMNHPYLAWYFITKGDAAFGTTYVTDQNTIGINAEFTVNQDLLDVLTQIFAKHDPLPAIKSVRGSNFTVNLPVDNLALQKALTGIGWVPVQISYKIT